MRQQADRFVFGKGIAFPMTENNERDEVPALTAWPGQATLG